MPCILFRFYTAIFYIFRGHWKLPLLEYKEMSLAISNGRNFKIFFLDLKIYFLVIVKNKVDSQPEFFSNRVIYFGEKLLNLLKNSNSIKQIDNLI